ncbi:MAG: hypothetical protein IOC90_14740 [Methylocystis sp.]|nr:hypothetical protein [Methylocystis sp.]MCA3584790.1 hypothetical protein [Methylocystis sp.]MCA3589271.1 hypothetical protein [Methylocystis sp.]MCA3593227.1 hypothetical protein [Methylocystis sp.]
MKKQSWFDNDPGPAAVRRAPAARPLMAPPVPTGKPSFAAKLRPHELIAMLTHHYSRVRLRALPKVRTSLSVCNPRGKQAVTIRFGG